MDLLDVEQTMSALATVRPLFHSEADLPGVRPRPDRSRWRPPCRI